LGLHYRQEQQKDAQLELATEQPLPVQPRIHRRSPCQVEPAILERVNKALAALRQQAQEMQWSLDSEEVDRHASEADDRKKTGDEVGAFRELCRAMLPLSAAVARHRNKGEDFNPRWDKPS